MSINPLSHREFFLRYGFDPEYLYTDGEGHLLTRQQALQNARYKFIPSRDGLELVEEMYADHGVFNGDGLEVLRDDRRRSVRRKPEGDYTAADLERSKRRALKRVNDLILCNDFDWFLTLTFDKEIIDRENYTDCCRVLGTWLRNRVNRHGLRYVGVAEFHKDGKALHFHLLCSGGGLGLVDSGTVKLPSGGKPVKLTTARRKGYTREQCLTVYNVSSWKWGFSTAIHTYGERLAVARYVGKYITKAEQKIGGRWYYSGGELKEPVYAYDRVDFDEIEADFAFSTPCGEFKMIYPDRRKG